MKKLLRGTLITLEGIDGSGKSTLARNLATLFENDKLSPILTREPGNTPLGKQLRPIVQKKEVAVCSYAEFLLFAADRAQHFHELVIPALQENKLVISDRMADSSLVYQGYGRGLDVGMLQTINAWAMQGFVPTVTVFVDLTPEQAFARLQKRNEQLTSFEREKETFTKKLVVGYEELFAQRDNVIRVDGMLSEEKLASTTYEKLITWLKHNNYLA